MTQSYDFRVGAASKKPLYGHDSPQTAYMIDDYPAGFRARCRRRVWLEYKPKQGWRFVSQTTEKWYPGEEPASDQELRWNKPDASTYADVGACLYLDGQDHVQWEGLGWGSDAPKMLAFMGDFPQADFSMIKAFAQHKMSEYVNLLMGRAVGFQKADSDQNIGNFRAELQQWAEVAKKAGATVAQVVKDLVDGTVEPQKFDPEAHAQRLKVRQEQIEAEKAKAEDAPGALNFADFEARLRAKVKLQGRSLVFKPGKGRYASVEFYNIEGPPPAHGYGDGRQEYLLTGFDQDRARPVAKVKAEMRDNSIGSGDSYVATMAARKETVMRAKSGTPEKVADYLAAHINKLIKDVPAVKAKTASYDCR